MELEDMKRAAARTDKVAIDEAHHSFIYHDKFGSDYGTKD